MHITNQKACEHRTPSAVNLSFSRSNVSTLSMAFCFNCTRRYKIVVRSPVFLNKNYIFTQHTSSATSPVAAVAWNETERQLRLQTATVSMRTSLSVHSGATKFKHTYFCNKFFRLLREGGNKGPHRVVDERVPQSDPGGILGY